MNLVNQILGLTDKVSDVVGKAVQDKDKARELATEVVMLLIGVMNNPITRWIRAAISVPTVYMWLWIEYKKVMIPDLVLGNTDKLDYMVTAVFGFYLMDFIKDSVTNRFSRK